MQNIRSAAGGLPPVQDGTTTFDMTEFNQPILIDRETRRVMVNHIGPSGLYVSDTAAHAAPNGYTWRNIFANSAAVIASATSSPAGCPSGTLTSVAIPAGSVWPCSLSTFTLTSGTVTAYTS